MPAVPSCLLMPVREQFLALLPEREDRHLLGFHNPRIADEAVFGSLVRVLVFGCGFER
ncbi:IS5/IS1182 family transposase, partial [Streptomyces sp. NPDC056534]